MSGEDAVTVERRPPLEPLDSLCLVPSKSTGLVSVCIQFAVLVVSALVAIFFFYHVGGTEYIGLHRNETFVGTLTESLLPDSFDSTTNEVRSLFNGTEWTAVSPSDVQIVPDDQDDEIFFTNTTIDIGPLGAQVDLLELIRISTLVYVGICCLWLLSLVSLLLSVKCEILDLVILNAVILTIAMLYALIHALFVGILLYYQKDIPWRTAAVVIGTVVVLVLTTCVCGFTLALVVAWYKYIVYVRDSDKCSCITCIVGLLKGGRKRGETRGQEYSMPEVSHNHNNNNNNNNHSVSQTPYIDAGPPVHQFSHF